MTLREMADTFRSSAQLGAEQVIREAGLLPARLSGAAAGRLYGREQIRRWQQEGLIAAAGSPKKTFDRLQLEAIAAASNRHTYLPAGER